MIDLRRASVRRRVGGHRLHRRRARDHFVRAWLAARRGERDLDRHARRSKAADAPWPAIAVADRRGCATRRHGLAMRASRAARACRRRPHARSAFHRHAPRRRDLAKLTIDRGLAPVRRRRRRWLWLASCAVVAAAAARGSLSQPRAVDRADDADRHDAIRRSSSSCSTPPATSSRSARRRSRRRRPDASSGSASPKARA